jgi:hypothetical protein
VDDKLFFIAGSGRCGGGGPMTPALHSGTAALT